MPRRVATTAALRAKWRRASAGFAHVGRLRTLGTLGDLVLYLLAFREAVEALRLDCGVVDEYVLAAAVRRDETESLRIVEPLHDPGRHRSLPVRRIWPPPHDGDSRLTPRRLMARLC